MKQKAFIILAFILFLSIHYVLAEPITSEWETTLGGVGEDEAYSVQEVEEGEIILLGKTDSLGNGGNDAFLIKTNSLGVELWNKTYGTLDNDFGYSIKKTSDGGFIIAGETLTNGEKGMYVTKTDNDGNEEWNNNYGGGSLAYSIAQTSDNGYIITGGYLYSIGLLKISQTGEQEWIKEYLPGSGRPLGRDVKITSDKGYIIAGKSSGSAVLIKTDSSGAEEWSNIYEGQEFMSVEQTEDGGFIATGRLDDDFYILKTDSLGGQEWATTYGGDGTDRAYDLEKTIIEGKTYYIVAGETDSFGAGSWEDPDVTDALSNVMILLLNNEGVIDNITILGTNETNEVVNAITNTSDGGYIIAGGSSASPSDVYIGKIFFQKEQEQGTAMSQIKEVLSQLESLSLDKKDQKELNKAIKELKKSLGAELDETGEKIIWIDENQLVCKHGKKVFDKGKEAVKQLEKINSYDTSSLIQTLIEAYKTIAQTAINNAEEGKDKEKAQSTYDKAETENTNEKIINTYKQAWQKVTKGCDKD